MTAFCNDFWDAPEASLIRPPTAILPRIPHSNCCKRVPNRPLQGRRGRFETLLQLLECGIFGRTAVRPYSCMAVSDMVKVRMCKRMHVSTCFQKKNASYRRLRGVLQVFVRAILGRNGLVVDPTTRCTAQGAASRWLVCSSRLGSRCVGVDIGWRWGRDGLTMGTSGTETIDVTLA